MPWVPSHANLRDHPKTRRAARRAEVSLPLMVGHLHMLWHWALDHAPDGDLSTYDAEDIAEAVCFEGDPDVFVSALLDCGPGDSNGFLDPDWMLHNWAEYGGRYLKRQAAAKKAAAARWASSDGDAGGDADALPPHADEPPDPQPSDQGRDANASGTASQPQTDRNAEERRGEERRSSSSSQTDVPPDAAPDDARARAACRLVGQSEHDDAMSAGNVQSPTPHLQGCVRNALEAHLDRAYMLAAEHPDWEPQRIAEEIRPKPKRHPIVVAEELRDDPEPTEPASEATVNAAGASVREALAARGVSVKPRRGAA